MAENGQLRNALALSVSALSAEHVLSATLSSPWSVAKFAQTDDDRRQVWRLFKEAAVASFVFAAIVGFMLRSEDSDALMWSIVGTLGIVAWVGWDYKRAMEGKL